MSLSIALRDRRWHFLTKEISRIQKIHIVEMSDTEMLLKQLIKVCRRPCTFSAVFFVSKRLFAINKDAGIAGIMIVVVVPIASVGEVRSSLLFIDK